MPKEPATRDIQTRVANKVGGGLGRNSGNGVLSLGRTSKIWALDTFWFSGLRADLQDVDAPVI